VKKKNEMWKEEEEEEKNTRPTELGQMRAITKGPRRAMSLIQPRTEKLRSDRETGGYVQGTRNGKEIGTRNGGCHARNNNENTNIGTRQESCLLLPELKTLLGPSSNTRRCWHNHCDRHWPHQGGLSTQDPQQKYFVVKDSLKRTQILKDACRPADNDGEIRGVEFILCHC